MKTPLPNFLLGAILILVFGQILHAAPGQDYWGYWDRSDESNYRRIDHGAWDALLEDYVVTGNASGVNRFRYDAMDARDRARLDDYIAYLAARDPREFRRNEQLAYWMNLYNAVSVQAVVERMPVGKGDIGESALPLSLWREKRIEVAGERLSLDDIEHRILRPIWRDHRVLFGLNCATLDCPNMQPSAYTGATVASQLSAAGRAFVNGDKGVHYDRGQLKASRLFQVYRSDFAGDDKGLIRLFAHYASDMKALYLLGFQGAIQYRQDLRLNMP